METLEPILEEIPELGPYQLDRLLSSGVRTEVWLAYDPDNKVVAVKVAREDSEATTLTREIEILRSLDQESVTKVLDADEDGRWFAMPYIRGLTMDKWALKNELPELIQTASLVLDALTHLHQRGVVHGDIKPGNVIIDEEGRPHLLDYNIAVHETDDITGFRGTLGYASPEVLRGEPADPRSDLYGFGSLLYVCLTGRLPFNADSPAALTYLPVVSLPAPPSTWVPELSSGLSELVLTLLARDPSRRPESALAVKEALAKALDTPPVKPVFGMLDERDALRRALASAIDTRPRVVVVYGPPGSGRNTLIKEAVAAGVREGMAVLDAMSPRDVAAALKGVKEPTLAELPADDTDTSKLCRSLLKHRKRALPVLFLVRASAPMPELAEAGAIQITPPLLSEEDTVKLVRYLGATAKLAHEWWSQTRGLPVAVIGRFHHWRHGQENTAVDTESLPPTSKAIYDYLIENGASTVTELAGSFEMNEHTLLDHCEILFAQELVEPVDNGAGLAAGLPM